MKWRRPALFGLGALGVILLMGGAYYIGLSRGQSTPQGQTVTPPASPSAASPPTATPASITQDIAWDVPAGSIPQAEEEKLKNAIRGKRFEQAASDQTYISVTGAAIVLDWAVLRAQEKAKTPQQFQPTAAFEILGHKTPTGWQLVAPNESDFCRLLKEVPDNLIDKDYYVGCLSQ